MDYLGYGLRGSRLYHLFHYIVRRSYRDSGFQLATMSNMAMSSKSTYGSASAASAYHPYLAHLHAMSSSVPMASGGFFKE